MHVILPGGCTPYDGLNGDASPERGTFFRLHEYEGVGILLVEVYKKRQVNLSFVSVRGLERSSR